MSSMLTVVCWLALLLDGGGGASMGGFNKADVELLEKYGGIYIPSGEGPLHYQAPVDAIIFESRRRSLDDDDLAAVFPAVRRMDPYRIHLGGRHALTDQSIALINRLRSLRVLDVSGTELTRDGLGRLRVHGLRQLCVSPERFSEDDAAELERALPGLTVIRLRATQRGVHSATPGSR